MRFLCLFIFILSFFPVISYADDGVAEIAQGSIQFKKTDVISMEYEDLYLSQSEITVKFEFKNNSNADYKTIVAFPMPDQSCFQDECETVEGRAYKLSNNSNEFNVIVNSKNISFTKETKATVGEMNVTDLLRRNNIDLSGGTEAMMQISHLSDKAKNELISAGAVKDCVIDEHVKTLERSPYCPQWMISEKFYWEQIFPANKITRIEHSYSPILGTTYYQPDKKEYCVDAATKKKIETLGEIVNPGQSPAYNRYMLGYILKSANTWLGPIKKFHLTIEKDKGGAVSTCFDGLKQTGARTFEASLTNFTPTADIKIAFVNPRYKRN